MPDEDDTDLRDMTSEPIDTDDGGSVVIQQQNAGPGNQVGEGEFKGNAPGRTPEEAAAEQATLEHDAPIDDERVPARSAKPHPTEEQAAINRENDPPA